MLETISNKLNVLETSKKRRLRWAEHTMKSLNLLLKAVIEQNPVEKDILKDQK